MRNAFRLFSWPPFAACLLAATALASPGPLAAQPQSAPSAVQRAAREQQLRELAIAGHGDFKTRLHPLLP